MRNILIVISFIACLSLLLVPAKALAFDPFGNVCDGAFASTSSLCQGRGDSSQNPLTGPKGLIRGIANILAFVTGLGAVITIMVGGFRLITANGDANQIKTARGAIVAAIIGLAIIALADTLISLVLSRI